MSVFSSKKDIRRFVQAKSVAEKKPFTIQKAERKRYVVKCMKDCCGFKLLFRGNDQGFFELVDEHAHTCISHVATIKREWVRERINDILNRKPEAKPEELVQAIHVEFHVTVKRKMISNALADVKRTRSEEGDSFGLIASFLEASRKRTRARRPVSFQSTAFLFGPSSVPACALAHFNTQPKSSASTRVTSKQNMAEPCSFSPSWTGMGACSLLRLA